MEALSVIDNDWVLGRILSHIPIYQGPILALIYPLIHEHWINRRKDKISSYSTHKIFCLLRVLISNELSFQGRSTTKVRCRARRQSFSSVPWTEIKREVLTVQRMVTKRILSSHGTNGHMISKNMPTNPREQQLFIASLYGVWRHGV